ncbi:OPT superfamily oligopeptide transporter [Metschnikowia bicuspidata]|uniref:OPT superfamily oligopeptide transporter n=1 Tax=Metschnikowia bicuspidata TaxID=27322 RepID=A0A4P9ZHG1_9ASCO|nr:OPT superfamily oligopeptide transporter [Metschnikowia bicuspidata]
MDQSFTATYIPWNEKIGLPQVTLRATVCGLLIGTIVLILNFQFGLQTGWVSMMSLPSALLGYTIFKLTPISKSFTDVENVYIQSVAVAVGTGPLGYGLVGIVPAMEKFMTGEESPTGSPITLSLSQLMTWSFGLAFFGVFFAVTLRKQVIIKENLPFPSGSATATLISVLHGTELAPSSPEHKSQRSILYSTDECISTQTFHAESDASLARFHYCGLSPEDSRGYCCQAKNEQYQSNIRSLLVSSFISASYTLTAFFLPVLREIPIFGPRMSRLYQWNFQPSPAYIGQGIIMGLPSVSYMLFGAVLGWGVFAPLSKYLGWAPGPIDDWVTGGQGWILWLSLSVMIADSVVSFIVVIVKSFASRTKNDADFGNDINYNDGRKSNFSLSSVADVSSEFLVDNYVSIGGIVLSSAVCVWAIRRVFGDSIPYYASMVAIILALFFSVLGVRALGETDLNPVSGIGKLLQLIFAAIIPKDHSARILINLVVGGIAEAGAQQAGDLMQDLKTGYLIGASPKAQFIAQLVGTLYSVFLSSFIYKVFNSVYEIPSKTFRIPTAVVWIDCSRLVTGKGLPPHALEFCIILGVLFGIISIVKNTIPKKSKYYKYLVYLPNGVAVGIGIYNTPNFTLARFVGGLMTLWTRFGLAQADKKIKMVIISSGLVLGEGLLSGVTMLMTSMGVRHH